MLRHLVLPLFILSGTSLSALGITGFEKESDGEATISFCNLFKVKNIAIVDKGFGQVVAPPLELGGYKNIIISSKVLDGEIKQCFASEGSCIKKAKMCKPKAEVVSARKLKTSRSVLAEISLDGEMNIVFFVSSYKKKDKDIYKVSVPVDLKFIDKKYRAELRELLIKKTKHLL